MTQIRGFIGATRRPGELGIHSLDGFNLVVPDMKLAETFYGEFGLELRARGNRINVPLGPSAPRGHRERHAKKERSAKPRNHPRVAAALPHSEGIAYKPLCGEIAMCSRVGRMGSIK